MGQQTPSRTRNRSRGACRGPDRLRWRSRKARQPCPQRYSSPTHDARPVGSRARNPPGDDADRNGVGRSRARNPPGDDADRNGVGRSRARNLSALTTPSSVSDVNRRILTLIVALIPIVVFGVLLAVVTVPYVSLGPGPAFDTLGEVDGKPVVDIKGTQTHPTTGHLDMTTVSQRDDLSLAEALTLWLSGQEQLMPRDLVYPPGTSRVDVDKANDADFKESEHNAEFAALGYLKYPEAVTVVTLTA